MERFKSVIFFLNRGDLNRDLNHDLNRGDLNHATLTPIRQTLSCNNLFKYNFTLFDLS